MATTTSCVADGTLHGASTCWALGFQRDYAGSHVVLGHAGVGGSVGFCVPDVGLAVAIHVSKLTSARVATRKLAELVLSEFGLPLPAGGLV